MTQYQHVNVLALIVLQPQHKIWQSPIDIINKIYFWILIATKKKKSEKLN